MKRRLTESVYIGMIVVQGCGSDTYDEGHQLQPLLPHRNEVISGFLPLLFVVSLGALYIILVLLLAVSDFQNE